MATSANANAHNKRKFVSEPAPLEYDSDSDFKPGAYIPEPKKKKVRKDTRSISNAKGKGKRRDINDFVVDDSDDGFEGKRRRIMASNSQDNVLLRFFGNELAEPDSDEEEDEDEDEIMEEDEEREECPSQVPVLRTFEILKRHISPLKPSPDKDSTTEESENDPLLISAPRKQPASPDDKDSTTEVSSDEELPTPSVERPSHPSPYKDSTTEYSENSETVLALAKIASSSKTKRCINSRKKEVSYQDSEPESDAEPAVLLKELRPKPAFTVTKEQETMGPFYLDGPKVAVPAAINRFLREYQRDGVRFFYERYKEARGSLLADDMGLGKTIQVISFLSAIMKKKGIKTDKNRRKNKVSALQDRREWVEHRKLPPPNADWPTCLIIAPSTVVENWKRELETWGYFEVGVYLGPKRQDVLKDFKMGRLDILLTSFDIARRDISLLDSLAWSLIFIDEVHRVKKESSKITKAYHQFDCQVRFGLTGTAIQNSYMELYSILNWTNPGRLGSPRQWKGYVAKPLTQGQSSSATEEQRVKSYDVATILHDKLLPLFFLRRTKEIIKDQLTQKIDQVVFCPLTPTQLAAYKRILATDDVQNLIHKDDPCRCGSGRMLKECCYTYQPANLFHYMSILIKLSNHSALLLPSSTDNAEQAARNRRLASIIFPDGYNGAIELQPQYCGKWKTLQGLLKEWKKDPTQANKVLIFTKSVKLLEMLTFHLSKTGYSYVKLTGETKQQDRMPLIDSFQNDSSIFIFLISTLAGGTGLNLTSANKVVIFDPNWNPAHDLQAMDRAFRFGQKRDVHVYRLLGAGCLEELIYARQVYKQQQMAIGYDASVQTRYFEGVQDDASKQGELFGLKNIFTLHEGALTTKTAIEKANMAELDWALANMTPGKKISSAKGKKIHEDLTVAEEKVGDDLKGLGALLFDEPSRIKSRKNSEQDNIEQLLSTIGVAYTHHNTEILRPSRIEEERAKKILEKTRRMKKTQRKDKVSKQTNDPTKPIWPPIRRRKQETNEQMLSRRIDALVALNMIESVDDFGAFALRFKEDSTEDQQKMLQILDEYTKGSSTWTC